MFRKNLNFIIPFIWLGLFRFLVIAAGLVLLIVPGVIFLIRFSFAQFSLVEDGRRGLSALSVSSYYAKGNFWRIVLNYLILLLFLIVIGIVVSIVATSVFGETAVNEAMGYGFYYLLALPLSIIYSHVIYSKLKLLKDITNESILATGLKKLWYLVLIGIVFLVLILSAFGFFIVKLFENIK
jgi:hypothetical protein